MISPASMVGTLHRWGVPARRRTAETRRRRRPTTASGRCPARPPVWPGQDLGFQEAEQQAVQLGADLLAGRDLVRECGDLGGQGRHVQLPTAHLPVLQRLAQPGFLGEPTQAVLRPDRGDRRAGIRHISRRRGWGSREGPVPPPAAVGRLQTARLGWRRAAQFRPPRMRAAQFRPPRMRQQAATWSALSPPRRGGRLGALLSSRSGSGPAARTAWAGPASGNRRAV